MTAWVVRAGKHGEDEQLALDQDLVCIRWEIPYDLSKVSDKNDLRNLCEQEPYGQDASEGRLNISTTQLNSFINRIQTGDIIILPRKNTLKTSRTIAVGRAGRYEFRENLRALEDDFQLYQTRHVKWLIKELPRSEMDEDTLRSINGLQTVFRINRDAEDCIKSAMKKRNLLIGQ